jgi:hypothetical protein
VVGFFRNEWSNSSVSTVGRGDYGDDRKIGVLGIQFSGYNVSNHSIKTIRGEVVIEKTGQILPLFLNNKGNLANPEDLIELPSRERISINFPLSKDNTEFSKLDFLENFVPFRFKFSTEFGIDEFSFDQEICLKEIESFEAPPRELGPKVKNEK